MQRLILTISMCIMLAVCAACKNGGGGNGNTTSVCNQSTGVAYVGLAAQSTSYQGNTGIYNTGDTGVLDPLAWCARKGAIITRVTNESGYNFSLAHGGVGSPFITMNSGISANDWNGQEVAGNYTAQYSGELNKAPSSLTVKVEWRQP